MLKSEIVDSLPSVIVSEAIVGPLLTIYSSGGLSQDFEGSGQNQVTAKKPSSSRAESQRRA